MSYLPSPQIHVWWVQYIPPKEAFCWLRKKIILYIKHSKTEHIGWAYLGKPGTKSSRPSYLPDLKRQVFIDVRCSYPPTQGSFPESFLKKIFSVPFPSADSSVHRRSPLNGPPLFPEAKSAVSMWRLGASQELSLGSGSLTLHFAVLQAWISGGADSQLLELDLYYGPLSLYCFGEKLCSGGMP